METNTRNATLEDLAAMLKTQQARKIDLVVPASKMRAVDGNVVVTGSEVVLSEEGVTNDDGTYRPTSVFDEGISEKLNIPLTYVRRLREHRPDLWDANVNGWLHGRPEKWYRPDPNSPVEVSKEAIPADSRSFLLRGFTADKPGEPGIARALLSDRYKAVDNLDFLYAVLEGVKQSGTEVIIDGCDLTDRRMHVRIIAPEMKVLAEELLRDYRNPFGKDYERWQQVAEREGMSFGGEDPVVFAGFTIGNSEVGNGAYYITPRIVAQPCKNGLVLNVDSVRGVHVGGRLEEGQIKWSEDTQRKQLDLITAQTTDAVTTFLSTDYLTSAVEKLEAKAGIPVEEPEVEVREMAKSLTFNKEQQDGILAHFIRGGQMTVGGVVNAITAYAQTVPDGDEAHTLEGAAARLLAV